MRRFAPLVGLLTIGISLTSGTLAAATPSWAPFGTGMNASVLALAPAGGGTLYAGGTFTVAGSADANRIAKWNGTTWSALGDGVRDGVSLAGPRVLALAVAPDGTLYAGGEFTTAGGSPANYIAKWNGTTWSALGAGVNGVVRTLAIAPDGTLYAGGAFTTAGGSPANHIAKWNGTTWNALGDGLNDSVNALAVTPDGTIYAGGDFTDTGGTYTGTFVRWNGSSWATVGSWVNGPVMAIAQDSTGGIVIAGYFSQIGGSPFTNIARWNGATWSSFGTGLNGAVFGLNIGDDDRVIAVGGFTLNGARAVAQWSGTDWLSVGTPNGEQDVVARTGDTTIVVGGLFTSIDGSSVSRIARLQASSPAAGVNIPTAALQQFGRTEGQTCEVAPDDLADFPALGMAVRNDAWGMSWAQWPNGGTGGFVCTRQPYYTNAGTWAVR